MGNTRAGNDLKTKLCQFTAGFLFRRFQQLPLQGPLDKLVQRNAFHDSLTRRGAMKFRIDPDIEASRIGFEFFLTGFFTKFGNT